MHPRTRALSSLALLAVLAMIQASSADEKPASDDWPCWRGPDRTGLSLETGLLKQWPEGGPKLAWKISGLGDGYSSPSIAGTKIFILGTKGRNEHLICLDRADGKQQWTTEIGAEKGSYAGPRSTPTVDGDRVYGLSSNGKLACLSTDTGKVLWKCDLMADFGGQHGNWAYAESPLIDGERVICTPGGDNATMVALDKKTGKEIWRAPVKGLKAKGGFAGGGFGKGKGKGKFGKMGGARGYSTAGYASAITIEVEGVKQYVQFVGGGVVGIAAKDGKLLWHYDEPGSGSNANCATPIFHEGSIFAAAGYRVGGGRAKLVKNGEQFKAEQVYFAKDMQNHHGGMVLVDGHVYGTNATSLVCLDFKTGEVKWTARGVGKGSVAFADGHLYHRGEDGSVALVEANPAAYKEKGRFKQPERSSQRAWAHPVIAGGKLYLRDWDRLLVYDLKK